MNIELRVREEDKACKGILIFLLPPPNQVEASCQPRGDRVDVCLVWHYCRRVACRALPFCPFVLNQVNIALTSSKTVYAI